MIEINEKLFKEALNRLSNTDDGRYVLSYLKDVLHWDDIYLSSKEPQETQYYATRRGVYGWLRSHVNHDNLKQIEFNYKRKVEHDRSGSTRNDDNTRAKRGGTRTDRKL